MEHEYRIANSNGLYSRILRKLQYLNQDVGINYHEHGCTVTKLIKLDNPRRRYSRPKLNKKQIHNIETRNDSIKFNEITDLYKRGLLK